MSEPAEEVLRLAGTAQVLQRGLAHRNRSAARHRSHAGRSDFASLIGPSGSGKSTLLNLLGLLDSPTAGELFLLGEATRGHGRRRAHGPAREVRSVSCSSSIT